MHKKIYCCLFFLFFIKNVCNSQTPRLVIPTGHSSFVNSAEFSSNNKYIITSSGDMTAKLWLVSSGKELFTLRGHTGQINNANFSPDNTEIITASSDKSIKIWNSKNGSETSSIKSSTEFYDAIISPQNNYVLTASDDKIIRLWEKNSHHCIKEYEQTNEIVTKLKFNNKGDKFLSVSLNNTVTIWDIGKRKPLFSIEDTSFSIKVFQDSDSLLGQIYKYGKSTNRIFLDNEFQENDNIISTNSNLEDIFSKTDKIDSKANYFEKKDFLQSGKYVLNKINQDKFQIYESNSGKLVTNLSGDINWLKSLIINLKSNTLLIPVNNKDAILYSLETHNKFKINGTNNWTRFSNFSSNGKYLALGSYDGKVVIYNTSNGKQLSILESKIDVISPTSAILFPDNKNLLVTNTEGDAKIINISTGKLFQKFRGHNKYITSSDISSSGEYIATSSIDSTVKIWDVKTGEIIKTLKQNNIIYCVKFNHEGSLIATASFDSTIKIWDFKTGNLKKNLIGHHGYVYYCQFTNNDSNIVSASFDSTAILWDLTTGKIKVRYLGHNGTVNNLSINKNDDILATGSSDSIVKIWNLKTGKLIRNLENKTDWVELVRFSPDSKTIAVGSDDGTLKLWEVSSGNLLKIEQRHNGWLWDIEFSRDGKELITASSDNKIIISKTQNSDDFISLISSSNDNWIAFDQDYRYDGTKETINKVYFICDNEIITLQQIKNQVYVPHLLEIIDANLSLNKLNYKRINDLDLCNGLPIIEVLNEKPNSKEINVQILERDLPVQSIEIFVNGLCQKIIPKTLFIDNKDYYTTIVSLDSLTLLTGYKNTITLRAKTNNNIYSNLITKDFYKYGQKVNPSKIKIFAVVIGIADYIGENNQLNNGIKFAKNDALSIANIIQKVSSKILLNPKEQFNLFLFNSSVLASNAISTPYLSNIQSAIDSIAKISTENDMIIFYFAGHGVINNGEFKMLTAECFNKECQQGITSSKLTTWLNSSNIKAQKRVFILDACNSGKMFKDILSIRGENDLIEKSKLEKDLQEFGEYSGIVGIAASNEGQSANENNLLGHGLLTYSLLKTLKNGSAISDTNKVTFNKWFEITQNEMKSISSSILNVEQEAQLFRSGETNLLLGKILQSDQDLIPINDTYQKILTKPNFYDNKTHSDYLSLSSRIVNENFEFLKSEDEFTYIPNAIWGIKLECEYHINGEIISFFPKLIFNNKEFKMESISGSIKKLDVLLDNIISELKSKSKIFQNKN